MNSVPAGDEFSPYHQWVQEPLYVPFLPTTENTNFNAPKRQDGMNFGPPGHLGGDERMFGGQGGGPEDIFTPMQHPGQGVIPRPMNFMADEGGKQGGVGGVGGAGGQGGAASYGNAPPGTTVAGAAPAAATTGGTDVDDILARAKSYVKTSKTTVWRGILLLSCFLFFITLMRVHKTTEHVEKLSAGDLLSLYLEVPSYLLREYVTGVTHKFSLSDFGTLMVLGVVVVFLAEMMTNQMGAEAAVMPQVSQQQQGPPAAALAATPQAPRMPYSALGGPAPGMPYNNITG